MNGNVIVGMPVEFKPILPPNFLTPAGDAPSIAIKDAPQEVLDVLVQRWLQDVYEKANKTCPFRRQTMR